MKKLTVLLLAGAILLATGCAYMTAEQKPEEQQYLLYFREADLSASVGGDALRAEYAVLEDTDTSDVEAMATALMTKLMEGPADATLKGTIPTSTQLLSVDVDRGRAVVDLSAAYGSLSGINLTLADYAITLTLSQLPEIMSVKITVRGQDLAYRNKQTFMPTDVLLSPKGDVVSTVPVTLYFLGENGMLYTVDQMLDLYEGDTQVSAVVKALEQGPERDGLYGVMPEGFRVRSVWLEDQTCYVNLSSAHLKNMTRLTGLPAAIDALRRSLCSLESVEEVRFLVDGEFARSYGAVNIEEPYTE
jgi:germination protein M